MGKMVHAECVEGGDSRVESLPVTAAGVRVPELYADVYVVLEWKVDFRVLGVDDGGGGGLVEGITVGSKQGKYPSRIPAASSFRKALKFALFQRMA